MRQDNTSAGPTSNSLSVVERKSGAGPRCLWLLMALVALLAGYPYLLGPQGEATATLLGLTSLVLLAGILAISRSLPTLAGGAMLLIPALVGNWLGVEYTHSAIGATLTLAEAGFYAYAIVLLLRYVLEPGSAGLDKVYGALSVYLLLGLAFFVLYELLETLEPGSFTGKGALEWTDLLYFSFATLTTLGYGDITPMTAKAQSLALVEPVLGVLYLAVLVAWLVGSLTTTRA